ncbi:MAG: toll/interleukin-1 receptor domain-containing protein [Chromatiaceae bacterium]|nr:toll/interleukin-1 receptor domain-containing protein [Chromatiaceae bacterium]
MSQRRPNGLVFVSYAHQDRQRVEPLVKALATHFNVWWDREIELGELWRQTLMDKLDAARCVVVVWSAAAVERDFIWSEVDRVKQRGIVIPVKLDQHARIPPGFDQMQYLDLTSWTGSGSKVLQELFSRIRRLLGRAARTPVDPTATLISDTFVLPQSLRATRDLHQLSSKVHSLGGILVPGNGPVEDLLGTLQEVHRTYTAVSKAISRFIAPVVQQGPIAVKPYLEMERGKLETLIGKNRGHCARIVEYYTRVGGLREWLEPRLTATKLKSLDKTFGELGKADGDLFEALALVGYLLTAEASVITGLLLAGQQETARKRILAGRRKLLPLERSLAKAMSSLQQSGGALGFVPADNGKQATT